MAFKPKAAAAAQPQTNQAWIAAGFINLSLPTNGGKQRKIGAIKLRASNERECTLAEWLAADPANVQKFAEQLIVQFTKVEEATEADDFALFNEAPAAKTPKKSAAALSA